MFSCTFDFSFLIGAHIATVKATVQTETEAVGPRITDRIIRLSGGGVGREYIASVFSRRSAGGELALAAGPEGVVVEYANLNVTFKPARHHLKLERVERE